MKIIFVIGGARSGKSSFVHKEVSTMNGSRAYVATAEALDDEMERRIQQHREERGHEWSTYEEPVNVASLLSDINGRHDIVVLDCLTLWLSNILQRKQKSEYRTQTIEEKIREFVYVLQKLKSETGNEEHRTCLFIVSNEVGMGIVPDNPLAREFRDHAGLLNQNVAGVADEVYLITAGIPVKIK